MVLGSSQRAQTTHQDSNSIGLAFEKARLERLPVVVIAGLWFLFQDNVPILTFCRELVS